VASGPARRFQLLLYARRVNFAAVRAIALALPKVDKGTSFGALVFKLRKKLLAKPREEGVVVVIADLADKEFLIRSSPDLRHGTHHDGMRPPWSSQKQQGLTNSGNCCSAHRGGS
jgi:hypothetical protein